MRNLEAESRSTQRLLIYTGLLFLLGLIALAIGTEIMVLELLSTSITGFWIWQGVWLIVVSFVLGTVAQLNRRKP